MEITKGNILPINENSAIQVQIVDGMIKVCSLYKRKGGDEWMINWAHPATKAGPNPKVYPVSIPIGAVERATLVMKELWSEVRDLCAGEAPPVPEPSDPDFFS